MKHPNFRQIILIWLETTALAPEFANRPGCSTVSWVLFQYEHPQITVSLRFKSSGAQPAWWIECLCSFSSNAVTVNAPLGPPSCISIVLSMQMLSNPTNVSPCYIFLGAFICACIYQRERWTWSAGTFIAALLCVVTRLFSVYLRTASQIHRVWEQQKDEDSNVHWNAGISWG